MIRKQRCWDAVCEDEPTAGLLNLFDVWIAFSVALLVALVGYLQSAAAPAPRAGDAGAAPATLESLASIQKIPRFRPTNSPLTGEGVRLGTAYRLKSGEVVYVPETNAGPAVTAGNERP